MLLYGCMLIAIATIDVLCVCMCVCVCVRACACSIYVHACMHAFVHGHNYTRQESFDKGGLPWFHSFDKGLHKTIGIALSGGCYGYITPSRQMISYTYLYAGTTDVVVTIEYNAGKS